jgi:hypothetical protein
LVTVSTVGSSFPTLLAVLTGNVLTNLTWVDIDDGFGGTSPAQVSFTGAAGTTYQIEVDGLDGEAGSISLTLAQAASGPPVFTVWPQNQTVGAGTSASFAASAFGAAPIAYQWKFRGINLGGISSSMLNLTNVQFTNAGLYTVIASNSSGTAVASALLMVGPSLSLSPSAGRLRLDWAGPYVLQTATNAVGPYTDLPAAISPFTNLFGIEPKLFFRLRSAETNSLSAVGFSRNSQLLFNGSGLVGYNYVIQSSTNLKDWNSIQTNTVPFQFVDQGASNYPSRFYRTFMLR